MGEKKQHDLLPFSTWTWSVLPCAPVAELPTGTTTVPSSDPQPHCAPLPLGYPTVPCSTSSALDYNHKADLFLAGYFLILLKLVSIVHPGTSALSSAPPQMSSLSLCCQLPSLICMVTFFSLSLPSAALGLHTSHVQDPSI